MTILLTGGSGKTSRRIASAIQSLSPSTPLLHTSRTPSPSSPSTVRFDWAQPSDFSNLFSHTLAQQSPITSIYLVLPLSAAPLRSIQTLVTLALSHLPASTPLTLVLLSSDTVTASASHAAPHARVHQYLLDLTAQQAGRVRHAVLRPAFFMQNFSEAHHRHTIAADAAVYSATGPGTEPFVSADDIAAVAARCLLGTCPLDTDYVIRGPRRLSYADVAAIVSAVTGRHVVHRDLTTEALRDGYVEAGMSTEYAAMLAGLDESIRRGEAGDPTDTVRKVVGREPISFEEFASEARDAWV